MMFRVLAGTAEATVLESGRIKVSLITSFGDRMAWDFPGLTDALAFIRTLQGEAKDD